MPAKNTKKYNAPDWEAVANDYVTGVLTIRQICEKHTNFKKNIKLNPSRLHYQMERRGYREARIMVKKQLNGDPTGIMATRDVNVLKAADTLQEITRRHIEGLKKTQHIINIMMNDMHACIKSAMTVKDQNKVQRPLFLGPRETVAEYMKKLAEVQNKTVAMERKCLGMDKEDSDDGLAPYEQRLKELYDSNPQLSDNSNIIEGKFTEN